VVTESGDVNDRTFYKQFVELLALFMPTKAGRDFGVET
jgi:hypothetical protein